MKTKNSFIKLKPRKEGKFASISNDIRFHPTLSIEAKWLMLELVNSSEEWETVLGFYSRQWNWGRTKQGKITKELKENGFLIIEQTGKGKSKTQTTFFVSEYGDVNEFKQQCDSTKESEPETIAGPIKNIEPVLEMPAPIEEPVAFDYKEANVLFEDVMKKLNVQGDAKTIRNIYWELLPKFNIGLTTGDFNNKESATTFLKKEYKKSIQSKLNLELMSTKPIGTYKFYHD